jgi:aspartate aminotransferase
MTVGSAGACNVILKSILDPGDEVIVLMPYFAEYQFYIANHGGRMVLWKPTLRFCPTWSASRRPLLRAPAPDSQHAQQPHRPRLPGERPARSGRMLARAGQPITVISDEPYKSFVYDGRRQPEVASLIANTAICNSWSKSLGLAGERIGYLALSPQLEDAAWLCAAPAPSAIAFWALSTRPQSGSG